METITLHQKQDNKTLIEQFCQDCQLRNMTKETTRRYKSSLKQFADHFKQTDLTTLKMQTLEEYLSYLKFERNVKHTTIENNFSALSAFCDYLVWRGCSNQNLVLPFRKRYLRMYKTDNGGSERQLISVEQMSQLANSIMDPRDKAILLVLAKTGVRRGELLLIDLNDINWNLNSIKLKPKPKRSNRTVYFDDECAIVLKRWIKVREQLNPTTNALFVSYQTYNRLSRNGAYQAVAKYAKKLGLHNPDSPKIEDHFGPHCCRHWFTTWLRRNGMTREIHQRTQRRHKKRSNRHLQPHRQRRPKKNIPSMHTKTRHLKMIGCTNR